MRRVTSSLFVSTISSFHFFRSSWAFCTLPTSLAKEASHFPAAERLSIQAQPHPPQVGNIQLHATDIKGKIEVYSLPTCGLTASGRAMALSGFSFYLSDTQSVRRSHIIQCACILPQIESLEPSCHFPALGTCLTESDGSLPLSP